MPYPVYDPKSFNSVDLRKYHIKDVKDVIRFIEFTSARMEEAHFVLKKFNTQLATFMTVTRQLQQKQMEQQQSYGNPAASKPEEPTEVIQKVDDSVEKEHEALLDEVRQATANESQAEPVNPDDISTTRIQDGSEARNTALYDKYKAVDGKRRVLFFRDNGAAEDGGKKGFTMVSDKDVPEDIKQALLKALGK